MILTFLLVSVIPISIAGIYSINLATDSFQSLTLEYTQMDLSSSAEEIYDFINYNKSDMTFLSKSPALRDYFLARATHSQSEIERWKGLLEEHFLIFCESRSIYEKVSYIDEDGNMVVSVEGDGASFEVNSDIIENFSTQQFFIETMKLNEDQAFITAASASSTKKTTLVTYAVPVFDEFERRRGIIYSTMSAEYFLKPLNESILVDEPIKKGSSLFLISNTNVYLTHRVGEEMDSGSIVEIASLVLSGREDITSGRSGTIADLQNWIITYTPIFFDQNDTEEFLVLVEVMEKAAVFSKVETFSDAFLILITSAIFISILAAIIITQTITKPLKELIAGTKRIAKKELSFQVKNPSDDEFGFLANSFNDMAKELEIAYSELEDKVKQRTIRLQLANEKLRALIKELKEANEKTKEASKLKSQFIANMSHELRTPLNSIIGFTDVLLDDENLDEEQKDYLKTILKNSESLLQLINDILDLSKIEANKMEIVYQKVKVEELLRRVHKLMAPLVAEKSIYISYECLPNLEIYVDKSKLRQIMINLLTNAIKFNKISGKVKTTVSYLNEEMDAVKFEVWDSGIGIQEKNFEAIFDEFQQIDGTETRDYQGTGLGLAISKKYVEMMGGTIWVNSVYGQWSKFSFILPVSPGEKDNDIQ
ncbi:MAG: HAMP domain-containing protein [Candidatus Methanofastidiosa archaeon]|nr:HAMP domain-containing protein [Candidatus Methanofastidiosa archaeon]